MTLKVHENKLKCRVDNNTAHLFFTLIDYRNNLFTSNNPSKIIEFYNGFESKEQLIGWMRERPKGANYIHEVEGDRDIIVVILTADFNGKYARECRGNTFKGLHIIFVESGGKDDFCFNYAHNCNTGIKKAMEYNPKWVVVSNDDVYKIDPPEKLITELKKIDPTETDVVFALQSEYHSYNISIAKPRGLYSVRIRSIPHKRELSQLMKNFDVKYLTVSKNRQLKIKLWNLAYFRRYFSFTQAGSFSIFSGKFIAANGDKLFDDNYINNAEDLDLSLSIHLNGYKSMGINYQIGDYIGSTLGNGIQRQYRSMASLIFFNAKWADILDNILNDQQFRKLLNV